MAASKKAAAKQAPTKKKAGGANRRGLDKPTPEPGDEPVADGGSVPAEAVESAVAGSAEAEAVAAAEESEEVTYIVARNNFQVIPPHEKVEDGVKLQDPGTFWEFPGGRPIAATPEEVALARQILDGKFSWGRVPAERMQRNARKAGLTIIEPSMAQPPLPAWDRVDSAKVVDTAATAGVLDTVKGVENAIRFEKQAVDRGREQPVSALVILQLEARLAELAENTATDGPSAGAVRLSGAAVELG